MKKLKIVLAVLLSAVAFMIGGCGINYYNMCGLGYTDCTANGCYIFGQHIPSAEFRRETEECSQAVEENRDDLDFAAGKLLGYDGKVHVYFVNGVAEVVCGEPELLEEVGVDGELMACFDRLAKESRFVRMDPMQFSASDPDSIYGICVSFSTSVPAYEFRAEYITDPDMLKYTGENIVGDWYFSSLILE